MITSLVSIYENDTLVYKSYFFIKLTNLNIILTEKDTQKQLEIPICSMFSFHDSIVRIKTTENEYFLFQFNSMDDYNKCKCLLGAIQPKTTFYQKIEHALRYPEIQSIQHLIDNIEQVYITLGYNDKVINKDHIKIISSLFGEIAFYMLNCSEIILLFQVCTQLIAEKEIPYLVTIICNYFVMKKYIISMQDVNEIMTVCDDRIYIKTLDIVMYKHCNAATLYARDNIDKIFELASRTFDAYTLYFFRSLFSGASSEMLIIFYEHAHKLFLIPEKPYINVVNILPINYYKLELVIFMAENHDFYFNEFVINTGLLRHLKRYNDSENVYFWERLCDLVMYYGNDIVQEYLDEINNSDKIILSDD